MTRMFLRPLAIGIATLLPAAAQGQSITLISNYPVAVNGTGTTIGLRQSKAAGFTIAAGPSYSLDSVTMRFEVINAESTLAVDLFGGSEANPSGPILASFVVPTFATTGIADYTFAPSSGLILAAGSTYWLATRGTSSNAFVNWLSTSNSFTGIATSAGYRVDNTNGYPPTTVSSVRNIFSVQATAITPGSGVPEPGTWALMLVGFGAIGYTARRPKVVVAIARAG